MDWKKKTSKNIKNSVLQGDIWLYDPDPVKGTEIGKKIRPCVVVSSNFFNKGASALVIIIPMTSKDKNIRSHIRFDPPNGGLKRVSFAMCEQIRSISKSRLIKRLGKIKSGEQLSEIEFWLQNILSFYGFDCN